MSATCDRCHLVTFYRRHRCKTCNRLCCPTCAARGECIDCQKKREALRAAKRRREGRDK